MGLISDTNAKTRIFSLKVDGKEHILRRGNTVGDLKLVSGTSEAIQVVFGTTKKTIKRAGSS